MSFIPGKPLYEVWFGHRQRGFNKETVERHRRCALREIASAMAQLKKYSFKKGGFVTFDSAGNPVGVGPMRHVDHKAMLDRWFIDNDPTDDPIYVESPEFSSLLDYETFPLDLHEEVKPFPRGVTLLLKLMIRCLVDQLEPGPKSSKPFVLAHPDYDIQNFLVSETGELQGIIDWDGIAAVPRDIGSERYPGWLTRDWDPAMYGWNKSMGKGEEPEGVWEDSPKSLKKYRRVYREMVAKCREKWDGPPDARPDVNITRRSLVIENLTIAAQDPQSRSDIVRKIVQAIAGVLGREADLDFMKLVDRCAEGKLIDDIREILAEGINALLKKDNL
ncbi:hypothetical protein B0T10DRAFT_538416 [Thelonectria olida]|uniref:Aminoglycoside phosphotransferase domain-containing protein n=1 Tax=Thelonectria olida TaxID=1576542 RepID=A0A9P8W6P6_9HYPO|nr:hypothetical protein B0T10DRAFT_538416 [Thelonectria olida]